MREFTREDERKLRVVFDNPATGAVSLEDYERGITTAASLAWHFAATLFLIFSGVLLGVALNAMSNLLGRVVRLPHALRLTMVCLVVAGTALLVLSFWFHRPRRPACCL